MSDQRDDPSPAGRVSAPPSAVDHAGAAGPASSTPDSGAPGGELPDGELPVEPATAFGVEGYDPEDPWNAALCVETATGASLLPLTPKTLAALIGALGEVDRAQRSALGAAPERPGSGVDADEAPEDAPDHDGFVHRARVVTGSAQLGRLWSGSTRGRLVVVGGAVLFVLLGILFSSLR